MKSGLLWLSSASPVALSLCRNSLILIIQQLQHPSCQQPGNGVIFSLLPHLSHMLNECVSYRVKQLYVRGCCIPPSLLGTPPNAPGQGTCRNVGSDIISQKRQQIPHNQSEYADSQIFGDRGLTLPLPQAVLWICSPVPLLILSRWNQLTTQQFQNDWSSISQSPSFPLLLSLLLGASSFFIMSLNSFFLLCIFPFPGYILPRLWALLSCLTPLLSNVALLFSLKLPLPWPK